MKVYVLRRHDEHHNLPEKDVNMNNAHEQNDAAVSIKVQQFRSRRANYVCYSCTPVMC